MTPVVFHIGYPRTATTTLQVHLFPRHPQLDYLGKFIPSHQYRDPRLFPLVDALINEPEVTWAGEASLRELIAATRRASAGRTLLLSTENFVHVAALDVAVVARRLARVCPDARIVVTIREQVDLLGSFFRYHGRIGSYLFLTVDASETIAFPLDAETWMKLVYRNFWKNILPTLQYDAVIREYERLFGADNVCVLLYEELVTNGRSYLRRLGEFLGIDVDVLLNLVGDKRENAAIPYPVDFGDPWLSMTRDYYRDGNRSLASRRRLPLADSGYSC